MVKTQQMTFLSSVSKGVNYLLVNKCVCVYDEAVGGLVYRAYINLIKSQYQPQSVSFNVGLTVTPTSFWCKANAFFKANTILPTVLFYSGEAFISLQIWPHHHVDIFLWPNVVFFMFGTRWCQVSGGQPVQRSGQTMAATDLWDKALTKE